MFIRTGKSTGRRPQRRKKKYARGKRAFAICDRSGWKIPYRLTVIEPGTSLRVDRSWSDGRWNIVDHPQNFPADVGEAVGLWNPRTDIEVSQVLLTSANGSVITDSKGLTFFVVNNKNILGEVFVTGA